MLDRKLHNFCISCKLNGHIEVAWIEGINLRHAKEKLEMQFPEATDIMDWTYEQPEDLERYKEKFYESIKKDPDRQFDFTPEDFGKIY